MAGRILRGGSAPTTAVLASGLRLVLNDWLTGDPDDDGLVTWREYAAGLEIGRAHV